MNDPSVSAPHGENLDTTDPGAHTRPDSVENDVSAGVDAKAAVSTDSASPTETVSDLDEFVGSAGEAAGLTEPIDLDAIERDLTDVQTALERLNDGSYWTDEITGAAIPDDVLASFPLTRTVAGNAVT